MSNSIDHNRRKGDNPIPPLSFYWTAIFKDGTRIDQIDKQEVEHKFQEVLDRIQDLKFFCLASKHHQLFTVDLEKGLIGYNFLSFPNIEVNERKDNIRLIFFRRHRVEMTEGLVEQTHHMTYHLGIQWNDKEGHNHKTVLQIENNGSFILGG
jgi:hypothetical protein